MTGKEIVRIIKKLREKGWGEKEINDFILYVEGEEIFETEDET